MLDTVGGDLTSTVIQLLPPKGRLVLISSPTPSSTAAFNVFEFYRKQLAIFDRNSISVTNDQATKAMQDITPYLVDGTLKPLPLHLPNTFGLDEVQAAFDLVKSGSPNSRVVISPWKDEARD